MAVPVVDYLVLDDGAPHLVGLRCDACGATYVERRNACAACGGVVFTRTKLAERGLVESFTIVHRGAPKDSGPFISAVVRLDDGAYVKANLVGVAPEPAAIDPARPVVLATFPAADDVVAFGFAYEGSNA